MNRPHQPRISALDGLRGVAIAAVMWHHLVENHLPLGAGSVLGWVRAATALSWTGVDLFFVLSGFFIGGILLDHRTSPRLARTFYLRRAVRILPLYYVTLALALVLVAIGLPGSSQLFAPWVYGLFLTNVTLAAVNLWDWYPFSLLWSLAVEEQFYLAAPWIARWIPPARVPAFLLSLIGGAWLLRSGVYWIAPGEHLARHVLMPMRMDALACGVLVAWLVRQPDSSPLRLHLQRRWKLWLAGAGAVFLFLTANHYLHVDFVGVYFGYTLCACIYALLLLVVVAVQPPLLVRMLASAFPVSLGRHSYFLYLWHMLIGWGIVSWLAVPDYQLTSLTNWGIVALAVGATWLAAVASWKFFESPLLRIGQRADY